MAELDLDEFLGVDGPVPVSASANRLGQNNTGGVHSLENAFEIDSPGDLSYQHRRQAFGPQFLVHTEKIYFHHFF